MTTIPKAVPPALPNSEGVATYREQYGCGAVDLTGTANALYERHLAFDNIIDSSAVGARERFEAFAHSVRDILSQRWVQTEDTYQREDPKRVYYLSMEFLLGRSLANNVTNLLLDPLVKNAVEQQNLDWVGLLEQEPDAGLGNGGLGRLAACFLDSLATMQLPAMGYGLRYEYGMFKQTIHDGWQQEHPDNWLRRPDPWEIRRPREHVRMANLAIVGSHSTNGVAAIHSQLLRTNLIFTDYFSRYEPGVFAPLRDTLLTNGDHYMHLADLKSYLEADRRLLELYAAPEAWARKAILNVAGSGKFSSDRTIAEYAAGIWNVGPCPVG